MVDIAYTRSCLLDAPCREEVREAALLDYVATVYGSDEENSYDGVLTDAERLSVESECGPAPHADDAWKWRDAALKYIHDARPTWVTQRSHAAKTESCASPFKVIQNAGTPSVTAIGGYHGCSDVFMAAFDALQLELQIAAAPEEWHFFVEGASYIFKNAQKMESEPFLTHEVSYFLELGRRLSVPVTDPVIPPTHPSICEEAARRHGRSVIHYQAMHGLINLDNILTSIHTQFPHWTLDGSKLWQDTVTMTANLYDISESDAEAALIELWGGTDSANAFRQPLQVLPAGKTVMSIYNRHEARFAELVQVSNIRSAELVRRVRAASKTSSHLYIIGRFHIDMMTNALLYGVHSQRGL